MLMLNQDSPNKFLRLICSPTSSLYSKQERHKSAVYLESSYIWKKLVPAISTGAKNHVLSRAVAATQRALKYSPNPTPQQLVVETLLDSHYRRQRNKGLDRNAIAKIVDAAYSEKKQLNLVGLMFTRKNICPLKRQGNCESQVDLAEIASLIHLNSFASLINKFYPWGVRYYILSEGKRYARTFDYTEAMAEEYQRNLQKVIDELDLGHISLIDYEDFLTDKLSAAELAKRRANYNVALKLYQERMLSIFNPDDFENSLRRAVELDPKDDPGNLEKNFVPVFRSILNSLPYPKLKAYADLQNSEYDQTYLEAFRLLFTPYKQASLKKLAKYILQKAWLATIEHNAQELADSMSAIKVENLIGNHTFRTTINPKSGSQLGIYTMKETTSRIQPWHGSCLLEVDGLGRLTPTILSKLELESKLYIPIYYKSDKLVPLCYGTKEAVSVLTTTAEPSFNMSTR